jgi:hypothetical protein
VGPWTYLWPLPMTVAEASFNGTLRTIFVLVIAWWVLRMILRHQATRNAPPVHRTHEPQRPAGEVRIERPSDNDRSSGSSHGTIVDADFEEIK